MARARRRPARRLPGQSLRLRPRGPALLALRRNEAMAQVLEQANRAIRRVAEQENLDAVFQEAAFANPRIDITEKVIKAISGTK